MGEETAQHYPEIYLGNKALIGIPLGPEGGAEIDDRIIEHFKLKDRSAFYALEEAMIDFRCRDQENNPPAAEMSMRRKASRDIAIRMRDNASKIIDLVRLIEADALELEDQLHWSPALMEAVFDVGLDTGIFLPAPIQCLERLSSRRDKLVEIYTRAFSPLARLPVRPASSGRMANTTLRHALRACRDYWVRAESKHWGMYRLAEKQVRDANNRADLTGEAEQFSANILALHDLSFTLQELSSAWKAIESDD